jgi:cAMP-dependent protein kinase regulator
MEGNWMFEALNPKDSKAILDAIVPVSKKKGDVIIKQGDEGDSFYILESGALNCSKFLSPNDAKETFLKEYKPGESFGELALLYNAPRAATIICKSASAELWSLDRMTFNSILKTAV